jgi:glucose-6-phosphate 1-epimerase
VVLIEDFHGQPAIHLGTPGGDRATVLLHGAQVVSWIPAGGSERIYLSERSAYGEGQAVRGGVPVIFPQFNQRGPDFSLPKHGFARTRAWAPDDGTRPAPHRESARLRLMQDAQTLALWPHPFSLSLSVSLGPQQLDVALGVDNPGPRPFAFTAALHSYLRIADIGKATVSGLRGVRYLDTVTGIGTVATDDVLSFGRETDRIYFEVPGPLLLEEPGRALEVSMAGFRDVVVWNPWAELCAALPDLPDEGYRQMLCIEAAAIDKPLVLQHGESWLGRQRLTAR